MTQVSSVLLFPTLDSFPPTNTICSAPSYHGRRFHVAGGGDVAARAERPVDEGEAHPVRLRARVVSLRGHIRPRPPQRHPGGVLLADARAVPQDRAAGAVSPREQERIVREVAPYDDATNFSAVQLEKRGTVEGLMKVMVVGEGDGEGEDGADMFVFDRREANVETSGRM